MKPRTALALMALAAVGIAAATLLATRTTSPQKAVASAGANAVQPAAPVLPGATPAPPPKAASKPRSRTSSLVELVQPLWSTLGEQQRAVLAPFADQWNTWSANEKRAWVTLATRFPKLSPIEQAKANERIAEWASLTPAQRKLARANYRLARKLPSDERVSQWQRYEGMTPEQRKVLRIGGSTSNTAAKHAGSATGLAKNAAKPFGEREVVWPDGL